MHIDTLQFTMKNWKLELDKKGTIGDNIVVRWNVNGLCWRATRQG